MGRIRYKIGDKTFQARVLTLIRDEHNNWVVERSDELADQAVKNKN